MSPRFTSVAGTPPSRAILVGLVLVVMAFLISQQFVSVRFEYAIAAAAAIAVFIFVFISSEAGLYLVLFSMLLSPELSLGGGGLAEGRVVVIRFEDILLIVIALSWFAKTAVNKDLGLIQKTPLNLPILAYVVMTLVPTLIGYLMGTVRTAAGFFYVLKYVEYFVVFFMAVNHVRDRTQASRLIITAFLTAAIVSVVGIAQIPSGQRVSAPFEGEIGEPNTFGGYLLFMMAVAGGIAVETRRIKVRAAALGLVALMSMPFLFTLSRASYLGVLPAVATLTLFSTRRKVLVALLVLASLASPLLLSSLLPVPVVSRVRYTFEGEQAGQASARLGRLRLDTSTSERILSMQLAFDGWRRRPIFGYGVTGFRFMDAQYFRTLVETGIVGLGAFVWLVWALLRSGVDSFRGLRDPEDRGIAVGFLAGTVGLLTHAIGANTFIIVRIMEPFWFFAALVVILPALEQAETATPAPVPPGPALGFVR